MNRSKPVIRAPEESCALIEAYMGAHDMSGLCDFLPQETDDLGVTVKGAEEQKLFKAPVRLGEVLDYINLLSRVSARRRAALVSIGTAVLDPVQGMFTRAGGNPVRLTEKEVGILMYLLDKKGTITPRQELLDAVWGYARDVETHTLETHIYRLRQKIEKDPSAPDTLITEENGYRIKR